MFPTRALIVPAMLLSACAGRTPAPRPSSRSEAATESDPRCFERVCVSWQSTGSDMAFRLDNQNPVDVTVTVELPVLENLASSAPLPASVVVPAGGEVEALRLRPVDARQPTNAQPRITVAFGGGAAVPDVRYRYGLPFGGSEPRTLHQGVGGATTHSGFQRFAFDFAMPIGTPVLAARDGVVLRVRDGSTQGGPDPALAALGNAVTVAQSDGTYAHYVHLSPGILVVVGQHVARGQRLGLSGNTGYTAGPHLHFHVGTRLDDGEGYSIPIRFDDGTPEGFAPTRGQPCPAAREVSG